MKRITNNIKKLLVVQSMLLTLLPVLVKAQEKVEINGQDVGSWFSRNWMWVAGVVLVLLLIVVFNGGGSSRRKTTTVVKDDYGNVKSITTTEIKE